MVDSRFEILKGLPPYGPMYIPVSENGEKFYSEGFVVRFFRKDSSSWVANFKSGLTDHCAVYEYLDSNLITVIAFGQGYIVDPNFEKPIEFFGGGIDFSIKRAESIIVSDGTKVSILNANLEIWNSPRISIDGIKEISIDGHKLSGLAYYPTFDSDEWLPFTLNLETKELIGGSYQIKKQKRKWWRIW